MWFGMGFMWLWPIVLVVIAVIIYYAVTASSHREHYSQHSYYQQPRYHGSRALEILKERYAKGEITKEQFHQMKEDLR
jgi:putative membrane protein